MRATLPCLALGVMLTGCAAHRSNVRNVWLPAYVFGAFGGGDLDVRDHCASGVADELSVGSSWATLGVSVATIGIYTPREVRLRCAPQR
ncbi:MAG TPA: hypothetical protein VJN18_16840 [Polyangiaceae bacterium]|nr:hypothetical protein [Polyangiaceae bacterium]